MSWTAAGFPPPQNVYPFTDYNGITRTDLAIGFQNQKPRWKNAMRTYQLEFVLVGADMLRKVEEFFWPTHAGGGGGYEWIEMPLLSESPDTVQDVRVIGPPNITIMGYDGTEPAYRMVMSIETKYLGA